MDLLDIGHWSGAIIWVSFFAAALVIAAAGTQLTRLADRLADMTGLGEALFGAILLGGTTSIPGIVTSVTAAAGGYAELAVSNAIGGIAVQTAFLAVADIAYRKANLEHAAASLENLMQAVLLSTLLALVLMGTALPDFTVWSVHPVTLLLLALYVFGMRLSRTAGTERLWRPEITSDTREDVPEETSGRSVLWTWIGFVVLGLVTATAGFVVAQTGMEIADRTGLSETVVGTFLTAVATSLPELVTSVVAVRQGAVTLAVGGIIGGNSFDVLFVAFSDLAYRPGSIYAAVGDRPVFIISLCLFLVGTLLLGLLRRERHGPGGIGFESLAILVAYAVAVVIQVWLG